jgi:hypothetical protein
LVTAPIPARAYRETLPTEAENWLRGGSGGAWQFLTRTPLPLVWAANANRIVAEHVKDYPGSRPQRWWEYSAAEPRLRVGGVGTPLCQCSAYGLVLRYGIPADWRRHGDFLGDREINIHPPIDPDDPPRFESEAAYLLRLNLLLPGELARLLPEDFESEEVD